jgi:DNA repair exonuclease SbcCD ATPase subunit
MIVVYGLMIGWTVFSLFYVIRLWKIKNSNKYNPYLYDSIPSVFTTLGILGTFVGIFFGLQKFDVNNITDSIPSLLEGMKTAFSTSIVGISLSLIFGRASQLVLRSVELKEPPKPTGELAELNRIANILESNQKESNQRFEQLNTSLIGETDESISTQLVKLRNQFTELTSENEKQNTVLSQVQKSLGGDGETSLLTQIQKLRAEQNEYSKDTKKNVDWIVESMNTNNKLISQKFEEFAELLAKNNTETLVEVMKNATEEFNKQMSELVNKLVQENFQELNNSVQKLNDWQKDNKEMIQRLTEQFVKVSEEFTITSAAIQKITDNTKELTDDNSHLSKLIQELQKVMIEDTKYQEIVSKLTSTIDTLKVNTEAFDETTNKLNNWVKNQMNFSDSVAKLLTRLEEIDRIKDINEVFWANTKKQLNEGVQVIEQASRTLSNDLENINSEFYERLNDTLQNLDTLIQRTILNYNKN